MYLIEVLILLCYLLNKHNFRFPGMCRKTSAVSLINPAGSFSQVFCSVGILASDRISFRWWNSPEAGSYWHTWVSLICTSLSPSYSGYKFHKTAQIHVLSFKYNSSNCTAVMLNTNTHCMCNYCSEKTNNLSLMIYLLYLSLFCRKIEALQGQLDRSMHSTEPLRKVLTNV